MAKQVPRITIITICTEGGGEGGGRGRERKREREGKKAFKMVKFMRATEPQIEIISLCTDK